jgi:hypothetical protein
VCAKEGIERGFRGGIFGLGRCGVVWCGVESRREGEERVVGHVRGLVVIGWWGFGLWLWHIAYDIYVPTFILIPFDFGAHVYQFY